jgi:hypothetical protein
VLLRCSHEPLSRALESIRSPISVQCISINIASTTQPEHGPSKKHSSHAARNSRLPQSTRSLISHFLHVVVQSQSSGLLAQLFFPAHDRATGSANRSRRLVFFIGHVYRHLHAVRRVEQRPRWVVDLWRRVATGQCFRVVWFARAMAMGAPSTGTVSGSRSECTPVVYVRVIVGKVYQRAVDSCPSDRHCDQLAKPEQL